MPAIISDQLTRAVLQCRTADEMRDCISVAIEAARAGGFGGEIGEIYRELCDRLNELLQRPSDSPDRQHVQMAHDLACKMPEEAGF